MMIRSPIFSPSVAMVMSSATGDSVLDDPLVAPLEMVE